jgi:hypothetical protein
MEPGLQGALVEKFENLVKKFRKISEKLSGCINYVHYKHVKFQCEIPWILGSEKRQIGLILEYSKFALFMA